MTQTMPAKPPQPSHAYRWRWAGLTAVLVAEAMNLLDATIVQVAGPAIHRDLGGSVSDIQWFSAAYTLAFALLLITGGRLGDIHGRRRIFQIGVAGFLLTSLACAFASSAEVLIALRVIQGSAAAIIIPQTFGLIRAMFDGPELPKALGTIGPVMGLASVCGPLLGGVLIHADLFGSSWRAVFLVNVPLAALVLVLAPRLREDQAPIRPRLDLLGTVLAMLGTGLIVYPLVDGGSSWALALLGLAALGGFAVQQRNTTGTPLVERSLFTGRAFPAALVTSTLFFAVSNGLMLAVVLHLQLGLGENSLTAGLTLLPWSVGLAIASLAAGSRLVPRFGARVMYAGLAFLLAGVLAAIAIYHAATPTAYPALVLVALTLVGVGSGLFTPPFFTSALQKVNPQETGSAAGLLNAVQQLGGTLGVAAIGSVYLNTAHHGGPADALTAVQYAFGAAAVLLLLTVFTVRGMSRTQG